MELAIQKTIEISESGEKKIIKVNGERTPYLYYNILL